MMVAVPYASRQLNQPRQSSRTGQGAFRFKALNWGRLTRVDTVKQVRSLNCFCVCCSKDYYIWVISLRTRAEWNYGISSIYEIEGRRWQLYRKINQKKSSSLRIQLSLKEIRVWVYLSSKTEVSYFYADDTFCRCGQQHAICNLFLILLAWHIIPTKPDHTADSQDHRQEFSMGGYLLYTIAIVIQTSDGNLERGGRCTYCYRSFSFLV